MSDGSTIEWTEATWNPTTGCDRVSPGCDNCYALTLAKRLQAMGNPKYRRDGDPATSGPGFGVTEHPDALAWPLRRREPRMIFVNSMSDLFHKDVTDEFIAQVFAVMALTPRHTYQVLTKRHARMRSLLNDDRFWRQVIVWAHRLKDGQHEPFMPLPNLWLGVSVENQQWADIRIPALLDTPAAVRWISAEPLLGPVDLGSVPPRIGGVPALDWVVVGGESGPRARPIHPSWVRLLRDQCVDADVAFFFKQWGGRTPKAGGRELDGREWSEYPQSAALEAAR